MQNIFHNWQKWQLVVFSVVIAWFIGANVWLAWAESQTIDEAAHITAGYSYITTRDFRLNPEHPPLLKEISALPLLTLNVKNVKSIQTWATGDEWKTGKDFVYKSPSSPRQIIFVARLANILVATTLGLLIFSLATWFTKSKSYGLLALSLFSFDPNVIAHSHYVTTDIASALGFLLMLASLFYYCNRPNLNRLAIVGVALGVSLAFKFSNIVGLLFVPCLLALSIFVFQKSKSSFWHKFFKFIKYLALVLFIATALLWLFYGFEVIRPSSSTAMSGNAAHTSAVFNHISNLYVPLYSYLRGLGRVLIHAESGTGHRAAYLLGNYYPNGVWYYFFVALIIKTPLVTLFLAFCSLLIGLSSLIKSFRKKLRLSKQTWYILTLVVFIVVYLLFSANTSINIGWRHILPIYPPIFILIAIAIKRFAKKFHISDCKMFILAIVSLACLLASLGSQWPYNLSYSNEVVPVVNRESNWPRLTDSNLDWGQDEYRLISYVNDNPPENFKYQLFSNANFDRIGFPKNLTLGTKDFDPQKCRLISGDKLVLSMQIIYNDNNETTFDCMRGHKPDKVIGSSILIFN
jgi:hypothetical protein